MITLLFDGKLVLAPLAQAPKRVLDVATGTGIWALEFGGSLSFGARNHTLTEKWIARSNPASLVIGTDLSKIQPNPNVPNCIFEKDDCEEPWHWGEKFDYIHIRLIVTCISNPQKLIQEAFSHLNPGGWLEIQDACMEFVFEDHENQGKGVHDCSEGFLRLTETLQTPRWRNGQISAPSVPQVKGMTCERRNGTRVGSIMRDVSTSNSKVWCNTDLLLVTDVKENRFEIACSPWPTEAKARRIGAYQQKNCLDGLRAMSYMMLRNAGYESHDIEALISDVKQELQERRYKGHTPL